MRAIIGTCVIVLMATAVLRAASGQGGLPQQGAIDDARPAPTSAVKNAIEIGDKLKISFYETIDMGAAKQGGRDRAEPQGALRTFYQRMDVSGDYTVEQDGTISIPLVGRLVVEGRTLDDVRADLAASFASVMGRGANIDVKISERSPIYVVGPVKNPGAYKHVPGMIVLHAVALAGGLDRGDGNLASVIEGAREMERLRSISLQVKLLLARRARLEAERDGTSTLPVPVQLAKLAGEATARTFIAAENTILSAEQARRKQQAREINSKVAAARNEAEALRRKLEHVDAQRDMRLERLSELQKLKDRGWATSTNFLTLRTELSDIEAHRQDYLVQIVQAEARLAEAEEAGPRLSSEDTANRAKAIATVDQEIATAQAAMTSARTLATILYRPNSGMPQEAGYEIVRQSKEGARTIQATETSPLMPGDVLKVIPKAAAVVAPSLVAPMQQPESTVGRIYTANQQ